MEVKAVKRRSSTQPSLTTMFKISVKSIVLQELKASLSKPGISLAPYNLFRLMLIFRCMATQQYHANRHVEQVYRTHYSS